MTKSVNKIHPRYRLEPTAAAVMHWASKNYLKGITRRYFDMLDLSSGDSIIKECDKICPWYGEVILNRKYVIKHLVKQRLKSAKKPCQVVIPGAGKCPLSLALLDSCGSKIKRIVEIDTSSLKEKKKALQSILPGASKKVAFIRSDAASKVIERTYNRDIPSIVIIEGLSYYISVDKLKKIIDVFSSKDKQNLFVMEYLIPHEKVAAKRRYIPKKIFHAAKRTSGLKKLTHYTKESLAKILGNSDRRIKRHFTLKDMELLRTKRNRYFKQDREGWIECITAKI